MQVTIDREKWARGREGGLLLRPCDGKMCALGFIYTAAGFSKKDIEGRWGLSERDMPAELEKLTFLRRIDITSANDSPELDHEEVETAIIEAARRADIEIHFIN